MKKLSFLITFAIVLFLGACSEGGDDTKKCESNVDCKTEQECRFNSIVATEGVCIAKIGCNSNTDCKDDRFCASDGLNKICGGSAINFNIGGSSKLSAGQINTPYEYNITINGATRAIQLEITSGALPQGLQFNTTTGVISGSPTQTGNFTFTVTAYDGLKTSTYFYNLFKVEKTFRLFVGVVCEEGYVDDGNGVCIVDPNKPILAGDLIFTEVMADSTTVPDDSGEWLEIYNTTNFPINLITLAIGKGTSKKTLTGENLVIQPKSHFVIAKTDGALVPFDAICNFGTMLTNTGAEIFLELNGVVVDTINYKASAGKSWQLDPLKYNHTDNDDQANWCNASTDISVENTDKGTPRVANTSCGGVTDPCSANPCTELNKNVCTPNGNNYICECNGGFIDNGSGVCVEDQSSPCFGNPCIDNIEEHRTVCIVEDEENFYCGCDDNYYEDDNGICIYDGPQILNRGDLIFTEIMADPSAVSDAEGEWLEIYNTSDKDIFLTNLNIVKGTTKKTISGVNTPVVIAPNSYFIIAVTQNAKVPVDATCSFGTMLSNSSAVTISIEIDGVTLDEASYTKTFAGVSWQLDPTKYSADDNDVAESWCKGTTVISADNSDKGTPKSVNLSCGGVVNPCDPNPCSDSNKNVCTDTNGVAVCSCNSGYKLENGVCVVDTVDLCDGVNCNHGECMSDEVEFVCVCDNGWSGDYCDTQTQQLNAGDLIVTEIMANPKAVTDTNGEWIEIYNTTNQPIDLTSLQIVKDTTKKPISGTNLIIGANSHFVIAKTESSLVSYNALCAFSTTILPNSGATISLEINGVTIDSMTYPATAESKSWQLSSTKYNHIDNDEYANWCVGTTAISGENSDLGTPGSSNNQCGQ